MQIFALENKNNLFLNSNNEAKWNASHDWKIREQNNNQALFTD